MHFATGVFSYLSAITWILFMVTCALGSYLDASEQTVSGAAAPLFFTMLGMLLAPKAYAVIALLVKPEHRNQYGGRLAIVASAALETFVSILVAPVMALYHTNFVLYALLGKSVQWNSQCREERAVDFSDAARNYWRQTLLGCLLLITSFAFSFAMGLWLLPFTLGLACAIPVAVLLSSRRLGEASRDSGLLLIPEETTVPPLLERRNHYSQLIQRGLDRVSLSASQSRTVPPFAAPSITHA